MNIKIILDLISNFIFKKDKQKWENFFQEKLKGIKKKLYKETKPQKFGLTSYPKEEKKREVFHTF